MRIDWALFRFPFDDPRWKGKFAIGGLLMLIATFLSVPFFWLSLPVQGYSLQIMRGALKGEPPSLPEWEDWGKLFGDGLKALVVRIVYLMPVLLLACCMYAIWMAVFFGLIAASDGPRGMSGDAASAVMGGMFAVYGLSFMFIGVITILSLPLTYLSMVAMARLAATDALGSAFQFGEVWQLARTGFKNFALAYLIFFAAAMGAGLLASVLMYTIILSCLYPFAIAAALIYGQIMMGALFGMAYYHSTTGATDQALDSAKLLPHKRKTAPLSEPPRQIEQLQAAEAAEPIKKAAPQRPPDTFGTMASERKWTATDSDSLGKKSGRKAAPEPPPDTKKTMTGRRTPAPGKTDAGKKKDE